MIYVFNCIRENSKDFINFGYTKQNFCSVSEFYDCLKIRNKKKRLELYERQNCLQASARAPYADITTKFQTSGTRKPYVPIAKSRTEFYFTFNSGRKEKRKLDKMFFLQNKIEGKQSNLNFIHFKINCIDENHLYCEMNCHTKRQNDVRKNSKDTTTLPSTKIEQIRNNQLRTVILTHFITSWIQLARLRLILILLLSLLAVERIHAQNLSTDNRNIYYSLENPHNILRQNLQKKNFNNTTIDDKNTLGEYEKSIETLKYDKKFESKRANSDNNFITMSDSNNKYDNFNDYKENNTQHNLIIYNNLIYKPKMGKYISENKNSRDIMINFINIQTVVNENEENYGMEENSNNILGKKLNFGDIFNTFEDDDEPNRFSNHEDAEKLMKLVMDGLGLQNLPDMKKINISQHEYASKYREYIRLVHERKRRELFDTKIYSEDLSEVNLGQIPIKLFSVLNNNTNLYHRRLKREITFYNSNLTHSFDRRRSKAGEFERKKKGSTPLHFSLTADIAPFRSGDVEEANVRLMLIQNPSLAVKRKKKSKAICNNKVSTYPSIKKPQRRILVLKIYQLLNKGRRLFLDDVKIDINNDNDKDETYSQWLQFDVTKAVKSWLNAEQTNLGLEVKCDNCHRFGARILNYMSTSTNENGYNDNDGFNLIPVLNIIGRIGFQHHQTSSQVQRNKQGYHHMNLTPTGRKINSKIQCYKENQRCCRHSMEVVFKEIKGFEFIIQPKVFDAGYCHGRCPPRYNPAHHHAMLQSLIWKQSRKRAPRPCCAPSKLVELEVLHVDEKDSEKLKISTWADMRVIECACS